jgi:hypothetical protein
VRWYFLFIRASDGDTACIVAIYRLAYRSRNNRLLNKYCRLCVSRGA